MLRFIIFITYFYGCLGLLYFLNLNVFFTIGILLFFLIVWVFFALRNEKKKNKKEK